jgi:L-rhamnose isomerase
VIGTRSTLKALLKGTLEPIARLRACEESGDYTARLALQEESKSLPWGAVWEHYCATSNVGVGQAWLEQVRDYENRVLSVRA